MTPCICSDLLWWHQGRKDELSLAIRQKQTSELAHIRLSHFGQFCLVSLTENLGLVFLTQLWCYTGCKKLGYKLFLSVCGKLYMRYWGESNYHFSRRLITKKPLCLVSQKRREQEQRKGRSNMRSVNRYKVKCHMTHQKGTPELGIFFTSRFLKELLEVSLVFCPYSLRKKNWIGANNSLFHLLLSWSTQ